MTTVPLLTTGDTVREERSLIKGLEAVIKATEIVERSKEVI